MRGTRSRIVLVTLIWALTGALTVALGIGSGIIGAGSATAAPENSPLLLAGDGASDVAGDVPAPQVPAEANQRQRAEDLARAASERFSEILGQPAKPNAPQAAGHTDLRAANGDRYGFEHVVFRAERGAFPTSWVSHLAITDEAGKRFLYSQRL